MKTELEVIAERLQRMAEDNASLRAEFSQERSKSSRERRRLRIQAGLAFATTLVVVLISPGTRSAIAQGYGVTLASLNIRMLAVEAKTAPISVAGTDFTLSGKNVRIVDGTGSTESVSGLGNLTIGYNSPRDPRFDVDIRTGSHNLIVGDLNNYTSYGGLIAGGINTISGPYSTVIGGIANTTSGFYSCVSGGQFNRASGNGSSVSGGAGNRARASLASISGGNSNTADGFESSVSGGNANFANKDYSSVSGGNSINQNDSFGWSGGSLHSP